MNSHMNAHHTRWNKKTKGTSDPYVKFRLGSRQLYRSRTISKTLNPVWNEHFMTLLDDINQILVLRCYDYDFAISDDYLGTCAVDLSSLKWNEAMELTLDLTESGKEGEEVWGQVCIGIRVQPKTQEEKDCVSSINILSLVLCLSYACCLFLVSRKRVNRISYRLVQRITYSVFG